MNEQRQEIIESPEKLQSKDAKAADHSQSEAQSAMPALAQQKKDLIAFLKAGGKSGITNDFGKQSFFDSKSNSQRAKVNNRLGASEKLQNALYPSSDAEPAETINNQLRPSGEIQSTATETEFRPTPEQNRAEPGKLVRLSEMRAAARLAQANDPDTTAKGSTEKSNQQRVETDELVSKSYKLDQATFQGMKDLLDRRKDLMNQLKAGGKSGITGDFGKQEIFDSEETQVYFQAADNAVVAGSASRTLLSGNATHNEQPDHAVPEPVAGELQLPPRGNRQNNDSRPETQVPLKGHVSYDHQTTPATREPVASAYEPALLQGEPTEITAQSANELLFSTDTAIRMLPKSEYEIIRQELDQRNGDAKAQDSTFVQRTVQKNENLWTIVKDLNPEAANTSILEKVQEASKINGLDKSKMIVPGMVLKIPIGDPHSSQNNSSHSNPEIGDRHSTDRPKKIESDTERRSHANPVAGELHLPHNKNAVNIEGQHKIISQKPASTEKVVEHNVNPEIAAIEKSSIQLDGYVEKNSLEDSDFRAQLGQLAKLVLPLVLSGQEKFNRDQKDLSNSLDAIESLPGGSFLMAALKGVGHVGDDLIDLVPAYIEFAGSLYDQPAFLLNTAAELLRAIRENPESALDNAKTVISLIKLQQGSLENTDIEVLRKQGKKLVDKIEALTKKFESLTPEDKVEAIVYVSLSFLIIKSGVTAAAKTKTAHSAFARLEKLGISEKRAHAAIEGMEAVHAGIHTDHKIEELADHHTQHEKQPRASQHLVLDGTALIIDILRGSAQPNAKH